MGIGKRSGVFITGASGGLGSALLNALATNDMPVAIATIGEIKGFGGVCTDYDALNWKTALTEFIAVNGLERLVVVFTAFDVKPLGALSALKPGDVARNISFNITDFTARLIDMVQITKESNASLDVVQIDSGASIAPVNGLSLYSAGKAFQNILLESLALEEPTVRVVLFEPGVMDTAMQSDLRIAGSQNANVSNQFETYEKDGILRNPIDVAETIVQRYAFEWCAKSARERIGSP